METVDSQARRSFKDRLVILETRPGWDDGQVDALLYDPGAPKDLTPYIIAFGFDADSMSWRAGSYRRDLASAVCEFRGLPDPAALSSRSPDDAEESARIEKPEGRDAEAVASHAQELVSGTMYLDVNGYDYESIREGKQDRAEAPSGAFVTVGYRTCLVEEEMAREGIPLTQPNIAFMSDKIARALKADARENAGHIAADTIAYWKSSCPDLPRRHATPSPAQTAAEADCVSRALNPLEARGRPQCVSTSSRIQ